MAKLTDQQLQRAVGWVKNYWKNPCSQCGGPDWEINNTLDVIPPLVEDGSVVNGPRTATPLLRVTCKRCCKVHWINGILAGVIMPTPTQGTANP